MARRAAIVTSLVQLAKLHGHDPWAYTKDVLTRLPTHLNSRVDVLHPHLWQRRSEVKCRFLLEHSPTYFSLWR